VRLGKRKINCDQSTNYKHWHAAPVMQHHPILIIQAKKKEMIHCIVSSKGHCVACTTTRLITWCASKTILAVSGSFVAQSKYL